MAEFIEKYKAFKIYDEKGRVYPLNIQRAMFMDTAEPAEETKNSEDAKTNLLLQETPEFKKFLTMINCDSDKVLQSLEKQGKSTGKEEQKPVAPLVQSIMKDREQKEQYRKADQNEDKKKNKKKQRHSKNQNDNQKF